MGLTQHAVAATAILLGRVVHSLGPWLFGNVLCCWNDIAASI